MQPSFIIVDLFCGAGGTTTGFAMSKVAKVIACVNHDPIAIKSHWANHPEVAHFEEDIRTLPLSGLKHIVKYHRKLHPNAKLILWASLECTNFSKAKGGQPRDADSRTLADHLDRYIFAIRPDYIQIENVVEFMCWGPLDDKGKPISRRSGADWLHWRNRLCSYGYRDEWKELNSADFGAYTSRNRLFGCFAKDGLPIKWPQATHSKNPNKGILFEHPLAPWKAVKEVVDLADEGKSIFNRKKPLCDNTIDVINSGIAKAIKEGQNEFLYKYYGNGDNYNSVNDPAGTLTTKDRFALVKINYILRDYKTGYTHSVEQPIGALPTVPKAHLLTFILNPSHGGHTTSINKPCPVIVARQDKSPLYLLFVLMDQHGIADIKMRMLKVEELKVIQGFPTDYILQGNQADQKKFIGNSVVPLVVKAWIEAMAENNYEKTAIKNKKTLINGKNR